MELSSIQHIVPEKLTDFQPDLFIVTLSHETRSTNIAQQMEGVFCRKVALCLQNQVKEYTYQDNQNYFRENGFEFIDMDDDARIMDLILKDGAIEELKITIDCTSMPHQWYYQIFSWFAEEDHLSSSRVRLIYTMASYVEEGAPAKVKKVKDFLKVKNNSKERKRALILGLGQEPNVSEMICKIVKPDLLYLFYADPPAEKHFVEKVFVNNHAVINETPIRNLISYPILNGQTIYQTLIDVILPLRNEYAITIIPQGPKIFSLASMLLQIGYPDTVLSYPVFKRPHVGDRLPCGNPVVMDIHFVEEE